MNFKILISPNGQIVDGVYNNALEGIARLGDREINRATEVSFSNQKGCWQVQGRPPLFVGEPILKTGFPTHKLAIAWEISFLESNMLTLRKVLNNKC